MSQHYILRREGNEYKAPSLESLRQWAQDGRILANDMVFSPRFQNWYRAKDLRELRDVLGGAEEKGGAEKFWLRKDDKNYVADSMETILEWASKGNVGPDDLVYHPTYSRWFRAGDSPQIASRFPTSGITTLPSAPSPNSGHHQPSTSTSPLGVEKKEELASLAGGARDTIADFDGAAVRNAIAAQGQDPAEDEAVDAPADDEAAEAPTEDEAADPPAEDVAAEAATVADLPATSKDSPDDVAVEQAEDSPEEAPPEPVTPSAGGAGALADLKVDIEYEDNARFKDDEKIMKLFYDVARVFIVTKDVRPGESVEAECRLPSTGDDFKGVDKKEIYTRLRGHMTDHLMGPVRDARAGVSDGNLPGYARFVDSAVTLVETLAGAEEVIGVVPPGRVVIGNAGRPKMSPAEEAIMLDFDAALKGVISCRAK